MVHDCGLGDLLEPIYAHIGHLEKKSIDKYTACQLKKTEYANSVSSDG